MAWPSFSSSAAGRSPSCETRYVVAAYLVIFGYLIVAAYKMGMVHEKPLIVTRRHLDATGVSAAQHEMQSSNVIEIRDEQLEPPDRLVPSRRWREHGNSPKRPPPVMI